MDKQEKLRKIIEILEKHGIRNAKITTSGNAVFASTRLYKTKTGTFMNISRLTIGFDENGNFFHCIYIDEIPLDWIKELCEARKELLEIVEEIKRAINET